MMVRQVIADYGLGADFGYSGFDILIERIVSRLLPTPY